MNRAYWDTSSILADAVRLPCHVARDVPGLAHLQGNVEVNGGNTGGGGGGGDGGEPDQLDDLKRNAVAASAGHGAVLRKNTRIDVPFWLAELLALHGVVDLSVPRPYGARVRNALDAEAKSVQLRHLSAWWYAIGVRLGSLMEVGELLDILQRTYSSRIGQIYSSGQHLAASSSMRNATDSEGDMTTQLNDNVDSLGGYTSISMSAEMVEFVNGLEESEMHRAYFRSAAHRTALGDLYESLPSEWTVVDATVKMCIILST